MNRAQASTAWSDVASVPSRDEMLARMACVGLAGLAFAVAIRLAPGLIDRPFTQFVNGIAGWWPSFDSAVRTIDHFNIFQGQLLLAIAAAALVKARAREDRATLIVGGVAAALAAALSRILQIVMPYSPRPMHDADLFWTAPHGADLSGLDGWSSLPSDHASLLFGVAFAIWAVDRRLGRLALVAAGVLGLARIYEGKHYLGDILGGAFLAMFAVGITLQLFRRFERPLYALVAKRPGLSAAAAFVFFAQAACLFQDVRDIGAGMARHLL